MSNYNLIEEALQLATGFISDYYPSIKVIFANQNNPRPNLNNPYITLEFLNESPEINDWEEMISDGVIAYDGYREIVYNFNIYADQYNQAAQIAADLKSLFVSQSVRDYLRSDYPMSIIDIGSTTNLTQLNVDRFEPRASFDLTLLVAVDKSNFVDPVGYFDTVEKIKWTNKPN